jgi:hypothetical protein
VPAPLQPLTRDGLVRLCFKPPQVDTGTALVSDTLVSDTLVSGDSPRYK